MNFQNNLVLLSQQVVDYSFTLYAALLASAGSCVCDVPTTHCIYHNNIITNTMVEECLVCLYFLIFICQSLKMLILILANC